MTAWRALARGSDKSVKAASREAGSRSATALTDWRWSGLLAPSGLARYRGKVWADGARIVDILDVFSKTYGKGGSEGLKNSNHPNHMRPAEGGAFISPSSSSAQRLLHATIFPSSETVHHTSAGLRFLCTPIAHCCVGQRPPDRPCARRKRFARSAMR
jgi:hypothetical protein